MSAIKFKDKKVADLSISHLPTNDYNLAQYCVNNGEINLPLICETENAFMFLVPSGPFNSGVEYADWVDMGYSIPFINLIKKLSEAGFEYAWFACGGPIIKGLKTYEHS